MSESIAHSDLWNPRVQQQNFRKILSAVSYPGSRERVAQEFEVLAVLACLADRMSAIHDRDGLFSEWEMSLLGAQSTSLENAQFVIAEGSIPPDPDWSPPFGSLESPELGATLLLQCGCLNAGEIGVEMKGPGIQGSAQGSISGLHPAWIERRQVWVGDFPKGVDFLLVGKGEVMAWPRTAEIKMK